MCCFYYESELKGKNVFLKCEQKAQIFFYTFSSIWGDLFFMGLGGKHPSPTNFLSFLSF